MALATGWDRVRIRSQPGSFIRAVIWRLYAGRLWSPELAHAAKASAPARERFGDVGTWGDASRAHAAAQHAVALIDEILWPEDGNG